LRVLEGALTPDGRVFIAEGMGGQLSIQSASGKGTAISIVLPVVNDSESES